MAFTTSPSTSTVAPTTALDFSIVISTYNGAARLPDLFKRLKQCCAFQTDDKAQLESPIRWEILVVDNNSNDETAAVVRQAQADWATDVPLRYCFEAKQGASYARELGVHEAQAELIGFLDDDNLPAPNWVDAAYRFAQAYPNAGAFGSQIHGEFEVEPTEELKPLLPFLAIVERGTKPLRYDSMKRTLPPSAGLVVRREAWLKSMPETCMLRGRNQDSMLTGEDTEALTYLLRSGWEIWYNPAMRLWHRIPHWRLERSYLIPFFQGIGLSRYVTRMQALSPWLRPLALPAYALNDVRKVLFLWLRHGFRLRQNLTAHCQLTLSLYSLRSPFFFWKQNNLFQS